MGLDGAVPFLLHEHHTGHRRPAILYAELLWVVWIQGVHLDQLAHFLLNSADSALAEAIQDLLNILLNHDNLCDQAELLVHAVLEK